MVSVQFESDRGLGKVQENLEMGMSREMNVMENFVMSQRVGWV